MPPFGSISRNDFIKCLRKAGFSGPLSGGKHQYMKKGTVKVPIPNPHRGDISQGLLAQILKTAGISREEWEQL